MTEAKREATAGGHYNGLGGWQVGGLLGVLEFAELLFEFSDLYDEVGEAA